MPACPYRSWSANDFSCSKPRTDTAAAKEIDNKLKQLIASRDALDQRLIGVSQNILPNSSVTSSTKVYNSSHK
jgi:hypothetical protein